MSDMPLGAPYSEVPSICPPMMRISDGPMERAATLHLGVKVSQESSISTHSGRASLPSSKLFASNFSIVLMKSSGLPINS